MVRLVFRNKVDIISTWNELFLPNQYYPAIIRLRNYVRKRIFSPKFSRKSIFKRDLYTCQYSGQIYAQRYLTIDHILPRSRGGKSSWNNCVTAHKKINLEKGNRTPEEAGLKLIKSPKIPMNLLEFEYVLYRNPHPDWKDFFPDVKGEDGDIYRDIINNAV